jgi:transposase-like protein
MTNTHRQRSEAEVAFAKVHLCELIASGSTLKAARDAMALRPCEVHRWRTTDPAFLQALDAAQITRNAEHGEARGRPPTPPDEVAFMKAELPRLVGEEGVTVKDALKQLGISRELLRVWRKDDPAFDQRMKDAIEDLTEHEADRLKDLHTEILDPKVCKVASDNTRFWLEVRNVKMRPRAPVDEGSTQLADILRSAVNRLIDRQIPQRSEVDRTAAIASERPSGSERAIEVTAEPTPAPRLLPHSAARRFERDPPLEGT